MNPLRTFHMVRPPTMTALMAALLMWTTWWLTDQFDPVFLGFAFGPIPLALLVTATFTAMFRLPTVLEDLKRVGQGGLIAYVIVTLVILTLAYVQTLNDRGAQIAYTCAIGLLGTAHFGFGLFDAETIRRTSANPAKALFNYSGPYIISGLGLIGKAIMSALLIDQVTGAVWIFAISIGALFYDFLIRWVTVLWLMDQSDLRE